MKGATDEEDKRMPQVWGNRHRKCRERLLEAGVTATMKCGLFMVAAPVDRFVCCTCGYSEEWLRKSNLDDIKERWAKKPK